jgi:DNA polymerase III delta subunit
VLSLNKLKIFLQGTDTDIDKMLQDLNFNEFFSEKPLTRARTKLINIKNAAQLALIMLNEEDGIGTIFH